MFFSISPPHLLYIPHTHLVTLHHTAAAPRGGEQRALQWCCTAARGVRASYATENPSNCLKYTPYNVNWRIRRAPCATRTATKPAWLRLGSSRSSAQPPLASPLATGGPARTRRMVSRRSKAPHLPQRMAPSRTAGGGCARGGGWAAPGRQRRAVLVPGRGGTARVTVSQSCMLGVQHRSRLRLSPLL